MGDESLLKRCPAKYQRLVMISGDYHVQYCVRNSLDNTKCIYATLVCRGKNMQIAIMNCSIDSFVFLLQYLYNLDTKSAYYDPKTRSMKQNPLESLEKGKS